MDHLTKRQKLILQQSFELQKSMNLNSNVNPMNSAHGTDVVYYAWAQATDLVDLCLEKFDEEQSNAPRGSEIDENAPTTVH